MGRKAYQICVWIRELLAMQGVGYFILQEMLLFPCAVPVPTFKARIFHFVNYIFKYKEFDHSSSLFALLKWTALTRLNILVSNLAFLAYTQYLQNFFRTCAQQFELPYSLFLLYNASVYNFPRFSSTRLDDMQHRRKMSKVNFIFSSSHCRNTLIMSHQTDYGIDLIPLKIFDVYHWIYVFRM